MNNRCVALAQPDIQSCSPEWFNRHTLVFLRAQFSVFGEYNGAFFILVATIESKTKNKPKKKHIPYVMSAAATNQVSANGRIHQSCQSAWLQHRTAVWWGRFCQKKLQKKQQTSLTCVNSRAWRLAGLQCERRLGPGLLCWTVGWVDSKTETKKKKTRMSFSFSRFDSFFLFPPPHVLLGDGSPLYICVWRGAFLSTYKGCRSLAVDKWLFWA